MNNLHLLCIGALLFGTQCCVGQEHDVTLPNDPVIKCLKRSCSFDFSQASVQDVAVAIKQQFDVNVVVDQRAFEEVGLVDPQITLQAEGIQLRSALLLMLEPLELTYTVRLETIVLTTQQSADDSWRAVVYDVTDLVDPTPSTVSQRGQDGSLVDFNSLILLIETSVRPDTWSAHSGPSADCLSMIVRDKKLLIIRQSEHGHIDIENLLASIRRELHGNRRQGNTEKSIAPKSPS